MKKFLFILLPLFLLFFTFAYPSFASNNSASFTTKSSQLHSGDEFVATISISSDSALNGIKFSLNFDDSVFEFQKVDLEKPEEYSFFSNTADNIEILSLKGTDIPLVMNIHLKVNDNISSGKYQISTSDIQVSHIENTDIESLEAQNLNVSIGDGVNFNITLAIILCVILILICLFIVLFIKKKKSN